MEEETWEGIPEVKRLAVEAAPEQLGLTMNELRARLRSGAAATFYSVIVRDSFTQPISKSTRPS